MVSRLRPNDIVWLEVCQRSLEKWKSVEPGDRPTPVDPVERRHHHLSDAVARAGLQYPSGEHLDPEDDLVLAHEDGNEIRLKPSGEILLGEGATRGVARLNDSTLVDGSTDAAFIGWVGQVTTFINGLVPGTIPTTPSTVAGKISSASDKVRSK